METDAVCNGERHSGQQPFSWLRSVATSTHVGKYLLKKYDDFKQTNGEEEETRSAAHEDGGGGSGGGGERRQVTEKQLVHLGEKINKLLSRMDDRGDDDVNISKDDECVICLSARATMQTFPCQHKVVCRKCFVKTIQIAISQRSLPLRCAVCRARILKLNGEPALGSVHQQSEKSHILNSSTGGKPASTVPRTLDGRSSGGKPGASFSGSDTFSSHRRMIDRPIIRPIVERISKSKVFASGNQTGFGGLQSSQRKLKAIFQ